MENIMGTLVVVGCLAVFSLGSGQLLAQEGDASAVLSFDFALTEAQEVRTIIWLKVVDGSPLTIYIYHGLGSHHPEPEYEGRVQYNYNRTNPCDVTLLKISLTDAGQYICSLKLMEKGFLVEPTAVNTLTVLEKAGEITTLMNKQSDSTATSMITAAATNTTVAPAKVRTTATSITTTTSAMGPHLLVATAPFPTTDTLSPVLSPTQSPSLGSKEQQRDVDFESTVMSSITFSSVATTAAIALLLVFLIVALYYRRRIKQKSGLGYSNSSLSVTSGRSEEGSLAATSHYRVSTIPTSTWVEFPRLDPPQRPPPALPAPGRDGGLCAATVNAWMQPATPATPYSVCPLISGAEASYPAFPPPATCGVSQFPCLGSYSCPPYVEVSRVSYACTGSHPGTEVKDSALAETIV